MRTLLIILLAAATGCSHGFTIPDAGAGVPFESGKGPMNSTLEGRVGDARKLCQGAYTSFRKEARDLERRHNLWATLGASFGATGGAAAIGASAASESDKAVKNTLTITGAALAMAGAVATGLSSKDTDLMNKLSDRALATRKLLSDLDELVAARVEDESAKGQGSNDAQILKKVKELEDACAEP